MDGGNGLRDPSFLYYMFTQAAMHAICEQWGVSAARHQSVLMVGDSPSNDVAFGKAAGVGTALLDTGRRLAEGAQTGPCSPLAFS